MDQRLIDHATSPDFASKYGKPKVSEIEPVGDKLNVPTERQGLWELRLENEEIRIQRPVNSKRFTLTELLNTEFPELTFYVERLLTSGLSLLWGYAKSSKSILIIHILLAIVSGSRALGVLRVKKAAVLYISLEDGPRRLQSRLRKASAQPNANFHLFFQWPRGQHGIEALRKFLDAHPEIKVVAIDTLQLFARIKDGNDYGETTAVTAAIKEIADDMDVAIVALHHSRKIGKEDFGDVTETALGSTGIVSGPDQLCFLRRTPKGPTDACLYIRSKDIEPADFALQFDHTIGGWELKGDAADLADTDERQEIINLLKAEGPMKTGAIAKVINKKDSAVSYLIGKLLDKGHIRKLAYGLYGLNPTETTESTKTLDEDSIELSGDTGLSGGFPGPPDEPPLGVYEGEAVEEPDESPELDIF